MASRRIASILIRDGITCVKSGRNIFPLWKAKPHINYMLAGNFTDLILACDNAHTLLDLNIHCQINVIAALGWSGVYQIEDLFKAGYSKVFFGGENRPYPSKREERIFYDMVAIYGASSFGYSMHFPITTPNFPTHLSSKFNEILIVDSEIQLFPDTDRTTNIAETVNTHVVNTGKIINLCAPHVNYLRFQEVSDAHINYVNYCEHGIEKYR